MVLLGGVSSIGDARRERDGVLRIVSRGVPRSRRLEITEACQHGAQASSNDPWSFVRDSYEVSWAAAHT